MQSKTETLASNLDENSIQSLQSIQTSLKIVSKSQNVKIPEEMVEKLKRGSHLKTLIPTNQSTGPGPVNHLVNAINDLTFPNFHVFPHFVILSLPFSVKILNLLCPMPW